ncbi:GNAT family N-acetyltransferase [Roseiconus nitratireducens]|nr:GNAT family N-acetyltransferase [Roseiconus nitratireducens]
MSPTVRLADYSCERHAQSIVRLLDGYARDPAGGGQPIPADRLSRLVGELARRPYAFSLLAFVDDRAVGLINCFESFSTFACQGIVNIHDVVVEREFRGRGIAGELLQAVEEVAAERGCCKMTMEVLEGNEPAQRAYRRFGFVPYQLREEDGRAMFWEKKIDVGGSPL